MGGRISKVWGANVWRAVGRGRFGCSVAGWRVSHGTKGIAERIVEGERVIGVRACVGLGRGGAERVVLQDHLDLVGADAQAVIVAQVAGVAFADRRVIAVDEGAVGAFVADLPGAGAVGDNEMAAGDGVVRIGQDPVDTWTAANAVFAAVHRTGLRGDRCGTTQDRQGQRHRLSLQPG